MKIDGILSFAIRDGTKVSLSNFDKQNDKNEKEWNKIIISSH